MVVMVQDPSCGYTLSELAEATGRRPRDLQYTSSDPKRVSPMERLKSAGIVQERDGRYKLSSHFADAYLRHLDLSGITKSERLQRYRHEQDKEAKRKRASEKTDTRPHDLKGREHMRRVQEENRKKARRAWIEEQRQKVGVTAATFIDDELKEATAVTFQALRHRWTRMGGDASELFRAIHHGPFKKYREADGTMAVTREDTPVARVDRSTTSEMGDNGDGGEYRPPRATKKPETPEEKVQRLILEGMAERFAHSEVYGEDLQL
jgi:hypothetical protein